MKSLQWQSDARTHRECHPAVIPTIRSSSSPPSMTSSTRCSTTWSSRCACWPWQRGWAARHHHHRLVHGALHPPAGGGALNQLVYCARQIQRQGIRSHPAPTARTSWESCRGLRDHGGRAWQTLPGAGEQGGGEPAKLQQANDASPSSIPPPRNCTRRPQPPHPAKLLGGPPLHQQYRVHPPNPLRAQWMPVYITGRKGWPGIWTPW